MVFNSHVGIKFNILTLNSGSTLVVKETCALLSLLKNEKDHCDGRWHQHCDAHQAEQQSQLKTHSLHERGA